MRTIHKRHHIPKIITQEKFRKLKKTGMEKNEGDKQVKESSREKTITRRTLAKEKAKR